MTTPGQRPAPVLKSGLYWRRSKWSGKKCVPAILSTDGQSLQLSSQDGVAFHVRGGDVAAKFSKLQTLTLTVGGQHYDLVGQPAHQSPEFSDQQRAELAEADRILSSAGDFSGTSLAGIAGAGVLGAGVGLAGVAVDAMGLVRNIAPWREILPAIGVQMH